MSDESKGVKKKYTVKDIVKLIIFLLLVCLMIGIVLYLLPWIIALKDEPARAALQEYIHSKGIGGIAILFAIQIFQVIVALIPGEPIEVIAGLLYGTVGGYIICTIGMLIGTVIIYYTVKLLGYSFINRMVGEQKLSKYKFLQNEKRLEMITFLLFFIPGTPKDLLTYFMPFTKIKPSTFFTIVVVARLPSIISSTFAGASIGDGKWLQTVIIFCVIGFLGIIGIIYNEKFMKKAAEKKEAFKSKINNMRSKRDGRD